MSNLFCFALTFWYRSTSRIALCNFELHLAVITGSPASLTESFSELRQATKGITNCLEKLARLRLTYWLPSSVVGCTALPLALHMLHFRLSSHLSPSFESSYPNSCFLGGSFDTKDVDTRAAKAQRRLNVLIQTMRGLCSRHGEVEWVSMAIRYFMECTYLERSTPEVSGAVHFSNPAEGKHGAGEPVDIVMSNLACYLRMAFTIDLSLSTDRLPEEMDFPSPLGLFINKSGCFVPILFGQSTASIAYASEELDLEQHGDSTPLPKPLLENMAGWIRNDRSLYFAQVMGLGPSELDGMGDTWYG